MSHPGAIVPKPSFLAALRLKLSARLMKRLLSHLPEEPTMLARMSLIQLNLGNWQEAIDYSESSIRRLPNNPDAHFNLARALDSLDRGKEALKAYDRALVLQPCWRWAATTVWCTGCRSASSWCLAW